uniref:GH18 domain-containing protein n=1 Tax=Gopherus agassizii TaxID=38772 RepID=A0A452J612_9SAUR
MHPVQGILCSGYSRGLWNPHSWLLFVALLLINNVTSRQDSAYKLVCYFTNWAQDRPSEGHFVPDGIDPHLCTHFIYAFANISKDELTTSKWNDATHYETFNGLKSRNPSLKTLLSIDRGKMGPGSFSRMVSSPANRRTFICSVIEFRKMNKFDGFSLCWIYPEGKNKGHFTSLIQMAKAFQEKAQKTGKQKLILSATVRAVRELVHASYEIDKISEAVDFLNLLTFDFHGSWQKVTGHVSPFSRIKKTPNPLTIMFIGVPISGPGSPGPFTQEARLLAYYEICTFTSGATTERIVEQEVLYSYKGNQ